MKKTFLMVLVCSMLFLLNACGQEKQLEQNVTTTESTEESVTESIAVSESTTEPKLKPMAEQYVKLLKTGIYQYSYVVSSNDTKTTVTEAANDTNKVYCTKGDNEFSRFLNKDNVYYDIDDLAGTYSETVADKNPRGELDFNKMELINIEEQDGKIFETYSMLRNSQEEALTLVLEKEELVGLKFSNQKSDAPYFEITEFTDEVDEKLFELPIKTTLSISEIADGTYKGTLSGDSYTGTYDNYTLTANISSSEISITIQNGQVALYNAASVIANGSILGVETPQSPAYTLPVTGTLPLSQIDTNTVKAEGDFTVQTETPWIFWDDNMNFTHWEIKTKESTYHCTVTIKMANGVPTADIIVAGSKSNRISSVTLNLK